MNITTLSLIVLAATMSAHASAQMFNTRRVFIAFAAVCASTGAEARELRGGGAIVRSPPMHFPPPAPLQS
jgi:hypothetical protein